jgi:glycosyltransferase involved in cell wall biosynthesis
MDAPANRCGSSSYIITTSGNGMSLSRHFWALADEMAARGHRVILLLDGRRVDLENHDANPAIYTWPSIRPTTWRDAIFLFRLLLGQRPGCIIGNFGATNLALLIGAIAGVPRRICWYHTLSAQIEGDARFSAAKLRLLRLRKRLIYRAAHAVVANSEAARNDVAQVFGVPDRKTRAFPYAIEDPFDNVQFSRSVDPHRIVCAGRLYPTKGQDVLIKALPRLLQHDPHVCVEFIGDGPSRAALEALAHDLDVVDRCEFIGAVPPRQVLQRMAAAVLTVVPSRHEAFGLVALESLAVGTPVVASRVGGLADIVRDGVDGFLVHPDDAPALADRILAILSSGSLAVNMRRNARAAFIARFEQRAAVAAQADWLETMQPSNEPAHVSTTTSFKQQRSFRSR